MDDSITKGIQELRSRALRRRLPQLLAMMAVYWLCLFVPAGTLAYPEAWAYLGINVAMLGTVGIKIALRRPEVVLERSRIGKNTKAWDKAWALAYGAASLGVFVLSGLDRRFGWTDLPLWPKLLGGIGLLVSIAANFWAMDSNPFLATTVRIQEERGHRVATTGPYAIVRHPMYAGMVISLSTVPLILNSLPAYSLSALSIGFIFVRTALEDRTLRRELEGYEEYTNTTHWRLVPGIW